MEISYLESTVVQSDEDWQKLKIGLVKPIQMSI